MLFANAARTNTAGTPLAGKAARPDGCSGPHDDVAAARKHGGRSVEAATFCSKKSRRNSGLRGLVMWFLLRVQEAPGSIPGGALLFGPRSLRARDPPPPPPAASAHAAAGAVLKEAPPACSVRHWRPPIEPAARRRFRGVRALSDAALELGHGRRQPPAPADEVAGRAAQSARLRTASGLEPGGELRFGGAS